MINTEAGVLYLGHTVYCCSGVIYISFSSGSKRCYIDCMEVAVQIGDTERGGEASTNKGRRLRGGGTAHPLQYK